MTQFAINIKRQHLVWCHNEIGRLYDLIMDNPRDKAVEKWHKRMQRLHESYERAERELMEANAMPSVEWLNERMTY